MNSEKRRGEISERLTRIRSEISDHVTLIVVTKNFPLSDIEILYELGERNFGENRVQELVAKRESLDSAIDRDITWHFQGGIQSNKTALLNRFADVIHSVDSMKVIDRLDPTKRVFLQINLDPEDFVGARSGIEHGEVAIFADAMARRFNENFLGVMGVAPHFPGVTKADIEQSFSRLASISGEVRAHFPAASWISGGMSDDYRLALAHGATHIRLGSSILGRREGTT